MRRTDTDRLERILTAVAEHTGVAIADMITRGPAGDRQRPAVRDARNLAYWSAVRSGRGAIPMESIGRRLNRTYHAVRKGVKVVELRRDADADFRRMTDDLRLRLAATVSGLHENPRHSCLRRDSAGAGMMQE